MLNPYTNANNHSNRKIHCGNRVAGGANQPNINQMNKTQLGESASANFEENTWTFEMPEDFIVTAGTFAIVPVRQYYQAVNNLQTIIANFPSYVDIQDMKDNLIGILNSLDHETNS